MDHFDLHPDLLYSEAELDEILMSRDLVKRGKKDPPPYKIVRDETVGRFVVTV